MSTPSEYNLEEFWTENGKTMIKDGIHAYNYPFKDFVVQEHMLIDVLKSIEFETVLEVGVGYGRVARLILTEFPSIKEYLGLDISPEQISNCKNHLNLEQLYFTLGDIRRKDTIPESVLKRKFDLVIASEVLMHIEPVHLDSVILRLIDLSKKHIINIDYYSSEVITLAPHNFKHDYQQSYLKSPAVKGMKAYKLGDTRQYLYHVIV